MKRWRLPDLKSHDKGFGDGLSAAFELVMTPAIFGVAGFFLDRAVGTVPLFTLVFSVLVLAYMVWKFWAQYVHDSDAELERWRAARTAARSSARHTNG